MRNPGDFFESVADEFTAVTKHPFRPEPLTVEELDAIADRILLLIEREKAGLPPLEPALQEDENVR